MIMDFDMDEIMDNLDSTNDNSTIDGMEDWNKDDSFIQEIDKSQISFGEGTETIYGCPAFCNFDTDDSDLINNNSINEEMEGLSNDDHFIQDVN